MKGIKVDYEEGDKFKGTRLSFIKELEPRVCKGIKYRRALFKCDCGSYTEAGVNSVKSLSHRSCGCLHKESVSTHNMTKVPGYTSYRDMMRRCYSKTSEKYPIYGGRGIKVCSRWLDREKGVLNFFEDMGERKDGHTLDRIDVNGDYTPENCRWAESWLQGYNKRQYNNNTSGRCGVSYMKNTGKYKAYINHKGKRDILGDFESFEEAVKAREEAEMYYYGYIKE